MYPHRSLFFEVVRGNKLLTSIQGELFEKTKERLQARTGIKGKPFEKIKFAVVKKSAYSKPVYLENGTLPITC